MKRIFCETHYSNIVHLFSFYILLISLAPIFRKTKQCKFTDSNQKLEKAQPNIPLEWN